MWRKDWTSFSTAERKWNGMKPLHKIAIFPEAILFGFQFCGFMRNVRAINGPTISQGLRKDHL